MYIFWLRWVFVAVRGLSLVVASGATLRCGARASHCGGFSCCGARALGTRASVGVAHGPFVLFIDNTDTIASIFFGC